MLTCVPSRTLHTRDEHPGADPVDVVASTLVKHLGLLFIPAAVGVVVYWPQIRSHAVAVGVALVVSVVMTIAVTALVLKAFGRS